MKAFVVMAVALCACATSFGAISVSGNTLTYGDPSDLSAVIDPPGMADVQASFGVDKAAFQALNPQVVGFNGAPAGGTYKIQTLAVQYNATDTVTFNFAAQYNYGGMGSYGRLPVSGVTVNDSLSTVETQPGNSWFDSTITTSAAGQGVAALGLCVTPRSDVTNSAGQAIFTLSDLSTVTVDYPQLGGTGYLSAFVGYQAPAGLTITGLRCTRPGSGNSYCAVDDLSFVMTPEPMTLSLLALGGLMAVRRRRA